MRAWLLSKPGPLESSPLALGNAPDPLPGAGDVLVRVAAAAIDATDLAVAEGLLPITRFPVIPGQSGAGVVEAAAPGGGASPRFRPGDRVAFARVRSACGACGYCVGGREHLCADRRDHGANADGALAPRIAVPERALAAIPDALSDSDAAALAGDAVLGYRAATRVALPPGGRAGILGYGSAAVVAQRLFRRSGATVLVFTRSAPHRQVARDLGAAWAGAIEDHPATSEPLDLVVSLGIAGRVLPAALRHLRPGGTLVFASAAFVESLPALDYARHLDRERSVTSVSSAPRSDLVSLFELAASDASFRVEAEAIAFESAPEALDAVKSNRVRGAAVILSAPRP